MWARTKAVGLSAYRWGRETLDIFNRVKAPQLGAALAFYVALSLAPMLVIVVGIVGIAFGTEAARAELQNQVRDLIGSAGSDVANTLLANTQSKTGGIISTVLGVITLVFGASGVFLQMQEALNAVWEVPPRKSSGLGLLNMLRDRLLSFSVVAGLAFLLLVPLVANAALSAVQNWLSARDAGVQKEAVAGAHVAEWGLSFLLAVALFALIFKVLPDRRVKWKNVAVGSVVTALLFNVGKYGIGLYLGTAGVGSAFGAAGSLVVLLVWVYYSTQILLFGASFTRVYSDRDKKAEGEKADAARDRAAGAPPSPVAPALA